MSEPGDEDRIAGSNPFPFLSREGVLAYRRSILRSEVLENCARGFGKGAVLLRNVSSRSKFVKDLWTHPRTMAVVREALGVDLKGNVVIIALVDMEDIVPTLDCFIKRTLIWNGGTQVCIMTESMMTCLGLQ